MREIVPQLTPQLKDFIGDSTVSRAPSYPISTFRRLVEVIAELSFANSDHLLFFRGQARDYQSRAGGTTIYPGIYRGDPVSGQELRRRFELLEQASGLLVDRWKGAQLGGYAEMRHRRYVQWSILQHYGVIQTPLLDVTQSLRVACSFAQLEADETSCFVYVLGLPQVTNRISVNSEHELVNVRLLSICPPSALRPHFQEGYLTGTTDIDYDFDSKTELDFRNRLIAKFEIPSGTRFWGEGFNAIPKTALYPTGDRVLKLCSTLREEIRDEQQPGDLGQFIREWVELEDQLVGRASNASSRNVSAREAISILAEQNELPSALARELQAVRQFRNQAVHRPDGASEASISNWLMRLRSAKQELNMY